MNHVYDILFDKTGLEKFKHDTVLMRCGRREGEQKGAICDLQAFFLILSDFTLPRKLEFVGAALVDGNAPAPSSRSNSLLFLSPTCSHCIFVLRLPA